jgi:hypothetical protein
MSGGETFRRWELRRVGSGSGIGGGGLTNRRLYRRLPKREEAGRRKRSGWRLG